MLLGGTGCPAENTVHCTTFLLSVHSEESRKGNDTWYVHVMALQFKTKRDWTIVISFFLSSFSLHVLFVGGQTLTQEVQWNTGTMITQWVREEDISWPTQSPNGYSQQGIHFISSLFVVCINVWFKAQWKFLCAECDAATHPWPAMCSQPCCGTARGCGQHKEM